MSAKLSSYYFIINPNSGIRTDIPALRRLIKNNLKNFKTEITVTKKQGHALSLAKKAKEKNFDCLVVVGGDGTINEVLPEVINSDITLGIIPKGSGNGFARELGLDLYPYLSIRKLPRLKQVTIDAGKINEHFFINAAGFGFDASVSNAFEKFAESGLRGQWPYLFLVVREYIKYKPYPIEIEFDSKKINIVPFLVAFSNSRQYGSGIKISPKAKINDGFFDLTIIPAEKFHRLAMWVPSLYSGKEYKGKLVKSYKIKKAVIKAKQEIPYHTDGEPRKAKNSLVVEVLENSIKLLVPQKLKLE